MIYNPIFEEEFTRVKEFRNLREAIASRATNGKVQDFTKKAFGFVKSHPVLTLLVLTVFGLGLGSKH